MGNRSKGKRCTNGFTDKKTGRHKAVSQTQGGAFGSKWVMPVEYKDKEGKKQTALVGVDKKARKAIRFEQYFRRYMQS